MFCPLSSKSEVKNSNAYIKTHSYLISLSLQCGEACGEAGFPATWHVSWLPQTSRMFWNLPSLKRVEKRESAALTWKVHVNQRVPLPRASTQGFCCSECQKTGERAKCASWRRLLWDLEGKHGIRASLCEILAWGCERAQGHGDRASQKEGPKDDNFPFHQDSINLICLVLKRMVP